MRAASLRGLGGWGIEVDPVRNTAPTQRPGPGWFISPPTGAVAVCVVPTDEEVAIARDVEALIR